MAIFAPNERLPSSATLAISKNICLNVFGSKQPRKILVFVILDLDFG